MEPALLFEEIIHSNSVIAARRRNFGCYKIDNENKRGKLISIQKAAVLVDSIEDIRDKCIVLMLLKTGVWVSELISMDVESILWQDNSIVLTQNHLKKDLKGSCSLMKKLPRC